MSLMFLLLTLTASFAGGIAGAMLGLGGAVIIIPALTLVFDLKIQEAVAISIVSVIATSSGSSITYLREGLANVRLGLLLGLGTTSGAITGALMSGIIDPRVLYFLFGSLLAYSGLTLLRAPRGSRAPTAEPGALARFLHLRGSYYDQVLGRRVHYEAAHPFLALLAMYGAGILAGLLGVGAGAFKVLAMDQIMGLPIKVSTSTSSFLIGVTAAAGAVVYIARGQIQPLLVAPVVLGVLAGALVGTRIMPRLKNATVRALFTPVLLYVAAQMLWKGWRLG